MLILYPATLWKAQKPNSTCFHSYVDFRPKMMMGHECKKRTVKGGWQKGEDERKEYWE
jgi:hypothetical protein